MSSAAGGCDVSLGGMVCLSRPAAAALFGFVNLIYFSVFVLGKSVVSLASYVVISFILFGPLFKLVGLATTSVGPVEVVSRSKVASVVECLYERANAVLATARDICLWTDSLQSAKALAALYALGYISAFFSLPALVFVAAWGAAIYHVGAAFLKETLAPVVSPYIKMADQFAHTLIKSIPRMEETHKKTL